MDKHCFKYFGKSKKLSWKESDKECKKYGARLKKIRSYEDEMRLQKRQGWIQAWLSLRKNGNKSFAWSDKQVPGFVSLFPLLQPHDTYEGDHCVAILDSGFSRILTCNHNLPYICEKGRRVYFVCRMCGWVTAVSYSQRRLVGIRMYSNVHTVSLLFHSKRRTLEFILQLNKFTLSG